MKFNSEHLDDHQVKVTVEVDTDQMEKAKHQAAKKLARKVKISGFRPGKAPYNVILRTVGEGAVVEEAIEIVLDEVYPEILKESGVEPYGPGNLEKVEQLDPPVFEITIPLAPEVNLGDYQSIRIPYEEREVTNKDVDEVLENLQDQQAVQETVDRAAKVGDIVYTLVEANREKPDEDGNTELFSERKIPAVIEAKSKMKDDEWPFKGFARELLDLSAGDEKEIEYTYPKDYKYEELQKAKVTFKVKVEEVKNRVLPKLNDEFAKSVSDFETIDDLKANIRERVTENYKESDENAYIDKILDQILDMAEIKYPPQMLKDELDQSMKEMERNVAMQGMEMDTYLKMRDITKEDLEEEIKPQTEERLKRTLVLLNAAEDLKVEISPDEVNALGQAKISEIAAYFSEDQLKEYLKGDMIQRLVSEAINEEILNRTYNILQSIARGEGIPEPVKAEKIEEPVVEGDSKEEEPVEEPAQEESTAEETEVEE
ncbi:MAG: trigger factor [Anaerolineales bacterium]|nr:trigger factor [Anaerolineales bacterium]